MSVMSFATPPFADKESVQRVVAALGGEPDGLQARYVTSHEGGIRIIAVWESMEHVQRFQKEKLGPALAQAMGEPTGTPDLETCEVLSSYVAQPAPAN